MILLWISSSPVSPPNSWKSTWLKWYVPYFTPSTILNSPSSSTSNLLRSTFSSLSHTNFS